MRVGTFDLDIRIGAGGMGEIWRGTHTSSGVAAAVKFDLHRPDATWREAFLAEVRRIAALDHPNVVHIFDTGIVTEAEAAGSGGQLVEGMPWLAMELARGGSVADDGNMPRTWTEVLHVITSLLRALASAHAAGIVHRDIKPGNLLLAGPRSSRVGEPDGVAEARVVLSDFGIGHDLERPGWMDEQSVGTPRFMAPEQIEANWRDQGPWTDLYQCGVFLWRMCTGNYPFPQTKSVQLYRAHLFDEPPAFRPNIDVPEGVEGICRQLLAKDPRDRPRFVADVLHALDALGDPVEGSGLSGKEAAIDEAPTEVQQSTVRQSTLGARPGVVLDMGLRSAGLGLWGIRPLPMVGRADVQRALWDTLKTVRADQMSRAVLIRGPAGVGKTRLGEWLCRRAHEEGVADVWRARHEAGSDVGLPGMLRNQLRIQGLERAEAIERIRRELELDGAGELLIPWLLGVTEDGERLPTPREKVALLRAVLARIAARRPLLVLLDDVHFGAEALQLVQWVLDDGDALPVLFLCTVRDEELAERPDENGRLETLTDHEGTTTLDLGPLPADVHRQLVRKMLGLEGRLAEEVERRTAGNPAFAVQLVNAWVESGRLVAGADGFRLEGRLSEALPDDLIAVWRARIDRILNEMGAHDRAAVEIAAVLGVEFETRTWRKACSHGRIRLRPGLVGALFRAHLVHADSRMERLRFVHSGLQEALVTQLASSARARRFHTWCAEALPDTAPPERRAHHLIAAGDLDAATAPLLLAIEGRLSRRDLRSPRLLDQLADVLTELDTEAADCRWGHLWLNRAWFSRMHGDSEKADLYAVRAERAAERHQWDDVLGWALREAGTTAMERADYTEALDYLKRAEEVLTRAGRPESAAFCRSKMANAYEFLGDFAEAERANRSCLTAFDDEPKAWVFAASPWLALAQLAQKQGRLDEALEHASEARWRAERVGQHGTLAHIAMLEGEVARYAGDLEAADRFYRESIERYEAFHDAGAVVPSLNLGVVGVLRGEFAETRAAMESLLRRLARKGGQPVFAAYARSVLLPCCAALGDDVGFASHFGPLMTFLEESGVADPDILKLARIALENAPTEAVRRACATLIAHQDGRLTPRS